MIISLNFPFFHCCRRAMPMTCVYVVCLCVCVQWNGLWKQAQTSIKRMYVQFGHFHHMRILICEIQFRLTEAILIWILTVHLSTPHRSIFFRIIIISFVCLLCVCMYVCSYARVLEYFLFRFFSVFRSLIFFFFCVGFLPPSSWDFPLDSLE